MTSSRDLSAKLVAGAFGRLFYWPAHDATVEKIWAEPGAPAALEALIDDANAAPEARFVAAEVLFAKDFTFQGRHDPGEIARIYTRALAGRFTHANVWGHLWVNDTAGQVGGRLIALDDASIPALRELLADRTLVDWYVGSEDATVGNGQRYRICDFAAYYLSQIIDLPLVFHADVSARDAEIERLKAALDAR